MKSFPALVLAVSAAPALATVPQLGTVEQPLNLGAKSDPGRIPLGPVLVESNHGYDVHAVITEPRACTHGALVLEKGLELNMNLASVFGMLVVPQDATQVPRFPVTIQIKDWPVPPYSPYSKEQVLAATIHCLLRSVHATPDKPLVLKIDARNPRDARDLAGFAGSYLTAETADPTPVPGTSLETDWRGVTSVLFDDSRSPASSKPPPRPPPALVPVHLEDGSDEPLYELLPVWAGDNWNRDPRELVGNAIPLFYDRFDQARSYGPDINALTRLGIVSHATWSSEVDAERLSIGLSAADGQIPGELADTLAALCHCLVLTRQPTAAKPLTIQLRVTPNLLDPLARFLASPGWTTDPVPRSDDLLLGCRFVRRGNSSLLREGSIPLGKLTRTETHRPWMVTFDP